MRIITTLILVQSCMMLFGQTDSLEKALLYNRMLENEITNIEFSKLGTEWNNTIRRFGNYPELPFNKNGQVHFMYEADYGTVGREYLFNRTLEWLSINYGLIPAWIYSNRDDGKIIFTNNHKVTDIYSFDYTAIISIKDGAMLIEYVNIDYQAFYEGHYKGDFWINDKTNSFEIETLYPVIFKKSSEWYATFTLLKSVKDHFGMEVNNLGEYIFNYDAIYNF
jgi:hypothetical protein